MIGLDTNILLRILVSEGGGDEARSRAFLAKRSAPGAFFVSIIVLVELVWTLRSRYGFARSAVAEAVTSLLDSDDFVVEQRAFVEEALLLQANRSDFADAMIARSCLAAGCERILTLDKAAARVIPGMELLR
jgi:predicted nucleic-acid-binding protein